MSVEGAVLGGIIGGVAMIAVLYPMIWMLPQQMKMNLLLMIGTMMVPVGPMAYVVGLFIHVMMSIAFGLVHGGLLAAFDADSAGAAIGLGVLFGLGHALVVGMVFGMMPAIHPRMRPSHQTLVPAAVGVGSAPAEELLNPPGFFGLNYPPMTVMGFFMLHIMFGVIVGGVYAAFA